MTRRVFPVRLALTARIALCALGAAALQSGCATTQDTGRAEAPNADEAVFKETVDAYMNALIARDYGKVASMMHPSELAKVKRLIVALAAGAERNNQPLTELLPEGATAKDVPNLSGEALFAALMKGALSRSAAKNMDLSQTTVQTVGVVREEPLTHGVCRVSVTIEGTTIEKMSVITLRDTQQGPRVMLTGELNGLVKRIETVVSMMGAAERASAAIDEAEAAEAAKTKAAQETTQETETAPAPQP